MLSRRELLTGGVLTGTVSGAAAGANDPAAAGAQGGSRDADERSVRVLQEIRDELRMNSGANLPVLETIRSLQREFLKGRGKFPDFIEVGIDVWESLVNWHVRTGQVAQVQRTADGRYAMALFQSNIVLRHDVGGSYIGQPYDGK